MGDLKVESPLPPPLLNPTFISNGCDKAEAVMGDLKVESPLPPPLLNPTFISNGCDKAEAVREIVKGREILMKVGSTLVGASPLLEIVKEAIGSFDKAISLLIGAEEDVGSMMVEFDENDKNIKKFKKGDCSVKGKGGLKRRRSNSSYSCTSIVSKTLEDGFTWRKYGQKEIQNARYPRSYYRCTHKFDHGCQAHRQAQRSEEDTSMYHITYIGVHTCRSSNTSVLPGNNFTDKNKQPCVINFKSLPKWEKEQEIISSDHMQSFSLAPPLETSLPTTTVTNVSDAMSEFGDVTSNLHTSLGFTELEIFFANICNFDGEISMI